MYGPLLWEEAVLLDLEHFLDLVATLNLHPEREERDNTGERSGKPLTHGPACLRRQVQDGKQVDHVGKPVCLSNKGCPVRHFHADDVFQDYADHQEHGRAWWRE